MSSAIVENGAAAAAAAEPIAEDRAAIEAQVTIAQDELEKARKDVCKMFARAQGDWADGHILTGKGAHHYLIVWMSPPLSRDRKKAVANLETDLSNISGLEEDVNREIRCYFANVLLREAQQLAKGKHAVAVPYSHWVNAWSQLIRRTNEDTPQETYVLLPGFEEQCLKLFAEEAPKHLSLKELKPKIDKLVYEHSAASVDETMKLKAKADDAKEEAQNAEIAARNAVMEAQDKAAILAKEIAAAKSAEEKATLTASMKAAEQELRQQQREHAEASAKAQAEAREAARIQRELDEQKRREQQSLKRLTKEPATAPKKPDGSADTESRAVNVIAQAKAMAKKGTAKDVAEMAWELISGSDTPDDVLHELLKLARDSGQLSSKWKRAVMSVLHLADPSTKLDGGTTRAA